MNAKQQRFVDEYLIDLNATQAAIRAGYSEKTAGSVGHENLQKPEIATAIHNAMAARSVRTEITQDMVMQELALIGFSNMLDYIHITPEGDAFVDLSQLSRDKAAAITDLTVEDFTDSRGECSRDVRRTKIKLSDKRRALVDIGKHLGMFVERQQVTVNDFSNMSDDELKAQLADLNDVFQSLADEGVLELEGRK